eukprot:6474441-Amphidinium_carterae.1
MLKKDWIAEFTGALLDLWRLPSYSASRWMSIGSTCRHYISLEATGYLSFHTWLRDRKILSEYEGGGADKMGEGERLWAFTLGLASLPADTLLLS